MTCKLQKSFYSNTVKGYNLESDYFSRNNIRRYTGVAFVKAQ